MLLSADREISNVVEFLKKEYNRRADFSPLLWSKCMKLQLQEVYTKLRLVSRGKAEGSEIDVDDIFESSKDDPFVLVEGSPGIGKTTFCLKLAHDWANDAMPRNFPSFKLVFLLKCRDIIKDVVEEIFEQLLPEDRKEKTKEALNNFLEDLNNQKQTLIILDGLDELPDESEDRVSKVLGRKKLSFCYVLVTTRQEKGIYTREKFKFNICLMIEGFSEENSIEYIRKHFRSIGAEHSSKGERLIEEIERNPLLHHLRSNPLNLLLLCVVYEDHDASLPSSSTDLYQTIVRCLLRRYCAREELKAPKKNEDLDKQFEVPILALGELAWKCLLNDRLSFYEDELEELERSNENIVARSLGLVYKEESLRRLEARHTYSFLHKTFQEYLAASHLAHKIRGSEFQMLAEMLFPDIMRRKVKQVFLFVCGLLREEANTLFELIGSVLQEDWDWSECDGFIAKIFVGSWKETGNAGRMAKTLCSFLPFPRPLHIWDWEQCESLCYVLSNCAEFYEELTVAEVHVSPFIVLTTLFSLVIRLPNLKSLILFGFINYEFVLEDLNKADREKLTFALFADVGKGVSQVPDFGLSSVRLRICGSLGSSSLQDIEILLLHKCLCSLSITVCGDVQESLVEAFARGLDGESAVKLLDLCVNGNFSFRGAYLLEQGILRNRSLTNIKVSIKGEPPENWQAVAKNIRAQFAERGIVSEIYPNTCSKVKDSQMRRFKMFLSKNNLKQQTATVNVWGELSGDYCKAWCEVLLDTPVSHLTLNIHGQLTDEMLRHIARCVEEEEKLSPITINAWVEMTEKENKLIEELGLDKNPLFSLNVCGTSAPLKESSDSKVVTSDEPQSLFAHFEKATNGRSKFTEDASQKSLTIKVNDDKSNEWENRYGLGERLAENTSLKLLTLEIDDYCDDNDEWGLGLGEDLARNASLQSLTIKIIKASFVSSKWEHVLGEGLAGNTSLKSLTLEIDDYDDDNDEWGLGLGEGLARNTSLESITINIFKDNRVNSKWEHGLGEGLAANTSLKSLTLETDDYGDGDSKWGRGLREGLAINTSLESLTIKIINASTQIRKEFGTGLDEGLVGNSFLGDSEDDYDRRRGLGVGLARNTSLKSLTIKKIKASHNEWAHGPSKGTPEVPPLKIDGDSDSEEEYEPERGLGEGLAKNTSLESLTIKMLKVGLMSNEWEHGLGKGLAGNTSLKSLTLEIDDYGDENDGWGQVLGESLAKNNSLNSLTLTINKCSYMSDEWGAGLAEGLAGNTSLKSITFTLNSYFYVSSVWALGLFEGSAKNTSLKSITLSINNYGTMKGEWRNDIIEGFARNTSLTSITLAINNYGDMEGEWGHCLFQGLARNTSLNSLTLTANNYSHMDEEGGCALRESLRKRESLTECNLIVDICGKC